MSKLFKKEQLSAYRDRRFKGNQEEFDHALRTSATLYIGNLSFYTTEEQIHELFSKCGDIKRIVMGLDKNSMTPCGFCFVVYYLREEADDAVKYISGTILDDRPIRVDFDWGFQDGRQWGRGRSGGQVRDEYRTDYDPGRGGYGKIVQREVQALQHYGSLYSMAVQSSDPYDPNPMFFTPPARGAKQRDRHGGNQGYRRRDSAASGPRSAPHDGDRKRRRDDGDETMAEADRGGGGERKERGDGGGDGREQGGRSGEQVTPGAGEGRGGRRMTFRATPTAGTEATPAAASAGGGGSSQKNPRFRERGDDSDEEGDK